MVRSLPIMLPCVALWGSWRREEEPGPYGSVVFLLIAYAATAQLLQVPWASLSHALYATPIAVVALVALLAHRNTTASSAVMFAGAFRVVAGFRHPATSAEKPEPDRWARLALLCGGLWVSPQDSALFQQVSHFMTSRPAGPIHVVGDAPEYVFLLGRPCASRVIYDVLADSAAKVERLVLPMRQQRVPRREFSVNRQLGRLVFDGRTFRHFLEVRWRDDSLR